jgi:acetoin utilization protein AcuC
VSDRVGLVLAPEARIYDHGPEHPLRPDRVLLTWDLLHAYGLDARANVETLGATPADDATLELVHMPAFIDATRRAGHGEAGDWARFGYGPGDNPIFDRMHEAGAIIAGASVAAAAAVWSGGSDHAFNAAGGLHHAMPARASGFCVYDDPAVAIAWLLARGCERIAYVDVDVHHGDGVQAIFWNEPRVLTVSLHQFGSWFFPGTGDLSERGGPDAPGSAINVPLPALTGDEAWLDAFRAAVP